MHWLLVYPPRAAYGFSHEGLEMQSFDVFFVSSLKTLLNKQSGKLKIWDTLMLMWNSSYEMSKDDVQVKPV